MIVGAGHAGGELAAQLRSGGYVGRIILIGDEPYLPYQRPPLSKAYLGGQVDVERLYLRPASTYESAAVEVLSGQRVVRIDRDSRQVELSSGRSLDYSRLVLATGGRARPLELPQAARAAAMSNHHYVRTIADVDRLRGQFKPGRRLVVVGGGYVGLEIASVGVKHGLQVTVLEAMPRVLARVAAPQLSAFYERVHRAAGVDLRTGITVTGFEFEAGQERVSGVECKDSNGTTCMLPADLVIVGIGQLPNVELAVAAGLDVRNGIEVDNACTTSDPLISAIGDCARQFHPVLGRRVRLESVPNAVEQARIVAGALCGGPLPAPSVPWFWSDQYDLKLQMVGLSQGYEHALVRGSIDNHSFAIFYVKGGLVTAADTVNRPAEFMLARRIVGERLRIDLEHVSNEEIPLKQLLPGAAPA